jgi:uncharacterized protein YciI
MFIVLTTYKKPLEIVDQYLAQHRSYLEEGYKKDYFIVSGPRNPRTGAIIFSQLKDKKQLEHILMNDPFSLNQIWEYEIVEFEPVKFHDKFKHFLV